MSMTDNRKQQDQSQHADSLDLRGTNLGYLFNRLLYMDENGMRERPVDSHTDALLQSRLDKLLEEPEQQIERSQPLFALPDDLATKVIELDTQYPGMYIGLGYAHGLPGKNADIKNGFFFDHTSGLPIIPASSVKGKLRSVFEELPEYVLYLLEEQQADCFGELDQNTVKTLLNELFECVDDHGEPLPMKQRTVFFDAYPVKCTNGLLGFDSITPHDKKGLKEPNPIKMLKVKGGVRWRFSFRFAKMQPEREQALMDLFQRLLMDWGIGAKTNVGYGTLVEKKT